MDVKLKPSLTYKEQIDLLKSRNLIINNEQFAERILSHVNYYRLSAYGLGLRKDNIFKEDVSIEDIYGLYRFDVELRYQILKVIEIIEITIRTKIAHHIASKYYSLAYMDRQFFVDEDYHKQFIDEFKREKFNQRDTAFVKHHNQVYDGKMPIWVAVELFTFGTLSKLYSNMKDEDKKVIAEALSNETGIYAVSPEYMKSWLKSLVEIRNVCAHYGKIYNRNFKSPPKLYNQHNFVNKYKIFTRLLVMKRLIYDKVVWRSFIINLKALLDEYEIVNLRYIGFPENWYDLLYTA